MVANPKKTESIEGMKFVKLDNLETHPIGMKGKKVISNQLLRELSFQACQDPHSGVEVMINLPPEQRVAAAADAKGRATTAI